MAIKKKKKIVKSPRVVRTHNGNTMTSAEWHGKIISALRQLSRWFKPPLQTKLAARRNKPSNIKGRHLYEYKCSHCLDWFKSEEVAIDHISELGSMKSYGDLPEFCRKLFCDKEGFQILCSYNKKTKNSIGSCHYIKTQAYMKKRKELKKGGISEE